MKTVRLSDNTLVPALGMGAWKLGDDPAKRRQELDAVKAGIRAGMTLLDTAELYGEGRSELLLGEAIRELQPELRREDLFLVSKVKPENAGRDSIFKSCRQSLDRLGVEQLDLYLLHWRGRTPLAETAAGMEELVARGMIRRWGVSNFEVEDLEELFSLPGGEHCAVNQVLYHLASRGIEFDLLPWQEAHGVATMAYCPTAQGGRLRQGLYEHPLLLSIAAEHHATPAQVLIAFTLRRSDCISIPRSSSTAHMLENAAAGSLLLTPEEWTALDRAFPAPDHRVELDML